jgi:hypothetical protein
MARRKGAREFKVTIDGIELSPEDNAAMNEAIQRAALTQIAAIDTGGDFAALEMRDGNGGGGNGKGGAGNGNGGGGTQGIHLVALEELHRSLPDLEGVLAEFRKH